MFIENTCNKTEYKERMFNENRSLAQERRSVPVSTEYNIILYSLVRAQSTLKVVFLEDGDVTV